MEKLVLSIAEAGRALGVGRSTAYALARTGQLPVLRLGPRRLVVPKAALLRMLATAGERIGDGRE